MGISSTLNLSCLAAACALSRRARLKQSIAPAVNRIKKMMTVKCRVRTLGSQLMQNAHFSNQPARVLILIMYDGGPRTGYPLKNSIPIHHSWLLMREEL